MTTFREVNNKRIGTITSCKERDRESETKRERERNYIFKRAVVRRVPSWNLYVGLQFSLGRERFGFIAQGISHCVVSTTGSIWDSETKRKTRYKLWVYVCEAVTILNPELVFIVTRL